MCSLSRIILKCLSVPLSMNWGEALICYLCLGWAIQNAGAAHTGILSIAQNEKQISKSAFRMKARLQLKSLRCCFSILRDLRCERRSQEAFAHHHTCMVALLDLHANQSLMSGEPEVWLVATLSHESLVVPSFQKPSHFQNYLQKKWLF